MTNDRMMADRSHVCAAARDRGPRAPAPCGRLSGPGGDRRRDPRAARAEQDRATYLAHRDESIADDVSERLEAMVRRREGREPVACILGEREFWGALLPRSRLPSSFPGPETEAIVEKGARADGRRRAGVGGSPRMSARGAGASRLRSRPRTRERQGHRHRHLEDGAEQSPQRTRRGTASIPGCV